MSRHISFWLVWLMLVLFLFITFFSELLTFKNSPSMSPSDILGDIFFDLVILVFITVGAFIALHRPENPIGWIICTTALIWVFSDLALEYAVL